METITSSRFAFGFNNEKYSDHILVLHNVEDTARSTKRNKTRHETENYPLSTAELVLSSSNLSGSMEELRGKPVEEYDMSDDWKERSREFSYHSECTPESPSCPDEEQLKVNSLILSGNSKFFEKLFTNGMKESNLKEIRIEVSKEDRKYFKDLIRFLYTGTFETRGVDLIRVIILADQYEVIAAIQAASSALGDSLDMSTVCEAVDFLAQLPNNSAFSSIVTSCRKYLYKEFSNFDSQEIRQNFIEKINSHRAAAIVLTNSDIKVSSENEIFQIVKQWLKFSPERTTHAPYLVPFIRYYLMSPDFLRYVVLPSEIFQSFNPQQLVKVKDLLAQALHYSMCKPEQKRALYSIQDGIRKRLMHPRVNSLNEPHSYFVDAPVDITEPYTTADFSVHGYVMNVRFDKVMNRDIPQLSVQLNLNHEATGINVAFNLTTMKVDIYFKDPITTSWIEIHSVEKCWIKNAPGKETRIRLPNQYIDIVGNVLPMRIDICPFIPQIAKLETAQATT